MRVQLIAKAGGAVTGTSRYAGDLYRGLQRAGVDVRLTLADLHLSEKVQRGLSWSGLDVAAFFRSYPVWAKLDEADVYHLTGQTLATLLMLQRFPGPVVVTVLDIIPYLVRRDPTLNSFRHPVDALFYSLALSQLKRADALVAISQYTKRTLIEFLGIPGERIHVVYPVVDSERFRPLNVPDEFRTRYGLGDEWRYILYVGSNDPRKNLQTLIRAFARVRQRVSDVRLLMVGSSHYVKERLRLLSLIDGLGLEGDVLFFEYIVDEDLPLFYNAADVFVFPSLYEGFGLPVAEAMACGTPVVVSNATSLPEVVGDVGLLVEASSVDAFAGAICALLNDKELMAHISRAGQDRAKSFGLQTVQGVASIYKGMIGNEAAS